MKKILIADDEHKILMSLEYSFRKIGYEVYIARDGAEVLEFLKTLVPDVILLDIMMPNLDGYSTLEEIKKKCSSLFMKNLINDNMTKPFGDYLEMLLNF